LGQVRRWPSQDHQAILSLAKAMAVSGSSGPGQSVPGLERLLDARMEELLQASRAPSTLKAYSGLWKEFSSFATDLRQPDCPASPALVELFLVWLDLEGRGSRAKAALGAISQEHTLQGQSNPTKGKRLRLVVDGVERDWAKAKDKVLVRDPFPVAAIRHHVEMAQTCRPELWIRDAFLVALGL